MARVNISNQGLSGGPFVGHTYRTGSFAPTLSSQLKGLVDKYIDFRHDSASNFNTLLYGNGNPIKDGITGGVVGALTGLGANTGGSAQSPTPGSPSPTPGSPSPTPGIDYLYADLAKAYGMDASTAYQEALSNTSYQRAVKDLQAAGLNPVLAATSLNGAGGVYGATPVTSVSPGISSAGVSSAHSNYKFLSNFGQVALGLGALLVTRNPYKAWTAASAGKMILGSLGNLMDNNF